jgi:hypothetical protein
MRSKLDLVEARLQALIESTVALFARGDAQHRLAHELIEAARQNFTASPQERAFAPNLYTVYLNPDSLAYWQAHRDLLDAISQSFQEAAREYGVQFAGEPQIKLAPDPQLPFEGIRVAASNHRDSSGHTAAFTPVPAVQHAQNIPQNAFLIVGGSHTFPLNRSVINIGRRPDNHLVVNDPRVSRAHAQIRAIRGQYVLFDLNSTGGTMVNGRPVHQCTLVPGDVISLSGVPLIYGEDARIEEEPDEYGYTQSMNPQTDDPPDTIE